MVNLISIYHAVLPLNNHWSVFRCNLKPEEILELELAPLTCQMQRKRSDDNHGKDVEKGLEQL